MRGYLIGFLVILLVQLASASCISLQTSVDVSEPNTVINVTHLGDEPTYQVQVILKFLGETYKSDIKDKLNVGDVFETGFPINFTGYAAEAYPLLTTVHYQDANDYLFSVILAKLVKNGVPSRNDVAVELGDSEIQDSVRVNVSLKNLGEDSTLLLSVIGWVIAFCYRPLMKRGKKLQKSGFLVKFKEQGSIITKKIKLFSSSLVKRIHNSYPVIILFILIFMYVLFFSMLTVDRHNKFSTQAFDLGIFDQAIWQFSQFSTAFNTVRGLHILGDHFTLINIIISPLYWFFNDVRALLILQTILLAVAAIPLFLIAKHYFKNNWIPLVFCFSYLLFPALQYGNLEDYHTESFVPFFILCAFYFIIKGKKWLYLIFFLLALTTKEDIALTTFLMGIYIYFKHDKKMGVFTSLFSMLWFFLAIKLFIPFFNKAGYGYMGRGIGNFGESPMEIIFNLLNPNALYSVLFTKENATFIWELFSPVGFLALLNPLTLLISASLLINLVAAWPYAHSIHYHYVLSIVPFIFLSVVLGIFRFKRRKILLYSFLTLLIISSAVANYYIAPYDASIKNRDQILSKIRNFGIDSESDAERYRMLNMIPESASVSASYEIVPHLTHRSKIYMFTNPFRNEYWGSSGEVPPLEYVDYLFLRKAYIEEHSDILQPLLKNNTYKPIVQSTDYTLFKRQN